MSKKQEPLIMLIIFLLIVGIAPIVSGPLLYFETNEPLYFIFPLIGIAGILLFISKIKKRKKLPNN
ncbi:hypothetical protein ACFQ4N_16495 [Oceanobacillus iheyensis]|uniref:Uncharacterized protein n=1 Tax=Oceanobacillus iheyensis (strain DSM 14371 / CIP 107618 / JCM 11309 / KCTC 3954 / HTE831) TaxID=221109 RepID=Q8EL72_OCEIH|nr:hypothetical protein [Oceanobacillus iheyensis]BAC15315.1 hypothetical protein [Oceanobacillus iheyensis HTE831]